MIRSIKALGLLVVAGLAIGAMAAPAAQAVENPNSVLKTGQTENELGEVELTGTPLHGKQIGNNTHNYFQAGPNAPRISCENETVKYYGKSDGEEKDLTLEPTYEHCWTLTAEHQNSTPVTVNMKDCDYRLTQPEHKEVEATEEIYEFTGTADLVCPGGEGPTITIYASGTPTEPSIALCRLEIEPNQTGLSHVLYKNEEGPKGDHVKANVTVEEIAYEAENSGCPTPKGQTENNAELFSTVTLTGGGTEGGETFSNDDDVWLSTES
jgi:hypothetical protein